MLQPDQDSEAKVQELEARIAFLEDKHRALHAENAKLKAEKDILEAKLSGQAYRNPPQARPVKKRKLNI